MMIFRKTDWNERVFDWICFEFIDRVVLLTTVKIIQIQRALKIKITHLNLTLWPVHQISVEKKQAGSMKQIKSTVPLTILEFEP